MSKSLNAIIAVIIIAIIICITYATIEVILTDHTKGIQSHFVTNE